MLVFSVVFMGFASTLAQSVGLATTYAAEFTLSNELSEGELAEIDGEGPFGAAVGAAAGFAIGATAGAVGAVIDVATGNGDQALKTVAQGVVLGTTAGAGIGLTAPTP